MGLTVFIEHRRSGIITHSRGSNFMDNAAGCVKAVLLIGTRFAAKKSTTHACQYLFKRVVHVPGLLMLVFTPIVVKAQHRNTKLIYRAGVNFAVVVVHGDGFPTAGYAHG